MLNPAFSVGERVRSSGRSKIGEVKAVEGTLYDESWYGFYPVMADG